MGRLRDGLVAVLLLTIGLRLAAWLLAPAVPLLMVLFGLGVIYSLLFGRRQ